MKLPQRPPHEGREWYEIERSAEAFSRILDSIPGPTVAGKYIHWDNLRHRSPPEGLTHADWWLGLKLRRGAGLRGIPLEDKGGQTFRFALVDPLPERLHTIDLMTGGIIQLPEQVTNPETRDRYVVRSLMEEAITSSQLEGAATTRDVAKEMIRQGRPPRDRGERMVLNNYRTMQRIGELRDEPLTPGLIFELHAIVTDRALDDPSGAGRFRTPAEYRVVGDDQGAVFHEPPDARQLDSRMGAMCSFANGEDDDGFIHPAIRSMILHFWLAYDHPFVDGNGRTARALFYWSMLRQKYWVFEFISISEIILKAPVRYGRAFLYTETDSNDLTYFLLYHAEIVRRAVEALHQYIEGRSREIRMLELALRGMDALNHRQRVLIGHALRHPGQRYTIESHKTSHSIVYQTARTDLLSLADKGLLDKHKSGAAFYFVPAKSLEEKLR